MRFNITRPITESFPGHKGRPGHVGGSLPKGSGGSTKKFTEEEKKYAINRYTGPMYTSINTLLRDFKGNIPTTPTIDRPKDKQWQTKEVLLERKKTVEALDAAIEESRYKTFESNPKLYRGLRPSTEFNNLEVGDVFKDYGFVSTASSLEKARYFAPKDGYILEIKVKNGQKALKIDSEEQEVILPRYSSRNKIGFKVLEIQPSTDFYPKIIVMELVNNV